MRILQFNEDIYDHVISRLIKEKKQDFANLLIKLREHAQIKSAPASAERTDGELSDEQKEAIRILHAGGSVRSLRWKELDIIYCCTYYQGNYKNIETAEVEALLKKGIIEGVVQNLFPDKEYVLTEFGKIVKV